MTQVDVAANEWLADPCPCLEISGTLRRSDDLERYCGSCCQNWMHCGKACTICQGTGKRHPWAWERCQAETDHCYKPNCADCTDCYGGCEGSGWVLDATEPKAMDFAETLGRPVLRKIADGSGWILDIWLQPHERESYTGKGETRLAAELDALRQVKE